MRDKVSVLKHRRLGSNGGAVFRGHGAGRVVAPWGPHPKAAAELLGGGGMLGMNTPHPTPQAVHQLGVGVVVVRLAKATIIITEKYE